MNEELDQWAKDNQFESKYSGNLVGGSFDPVQLQSYLDNTYSTLSGEDRLKTYLGLDKIFNDIVNPIIEADTLERGQPVVSKESYDKYYTNIADRLKAAIGVGELQSYNTNEYIIPGSEDYNNYSLVVYNPETGKYKQQSVLLNQRLREALASDWYKEIQRIVNLPVFYKRAAI